MLHDCSQMNNVEKNLNAENRALHILQKKLCVEHCNEMPSSWS